MARFITSSHMPPLLKGNLLPSFFLWFTCMTVGSKVRLSLPQEERAAGPHRFLYSFNGGRVEAVLLQYGQQQNSCR